MTYKETGIEGLADYVLVTYHDQPDKPSYRLAKAYCELKEQLSTIARSTEERVEEGV